MKKIFLGKFADVPPGRSKTFLAEGKKIFVMNLDGQIKSYVNFCPHMGGMLFGNGRKIKCHWHGAEFDAGSGEALTLPATGQKLERAAVMLEGDDLYYLPGEPERSPWADDF